MVAAIWSMPFSKARDIPLELFLNFFNNHGLFKLKRTDHNGILFQTEAKHMFQKF